MVKKLQIGQIILIIVLNEPSLVYSILQRRKLKMSNGNIQSPAPV